MCVRATCPSNHVSCFRVHLTCSTSTCLCHKVALAIILRKYYNCPSSRLFPVSHPVFYGNHKNIAEARHPTAGKSERKERNQRACELGWVWGDLCDSCRNSHFCTQLKDIKAMLKLSPVSDPLPPRTQIKVTQCPIINKHAELWACVIMTEISRLFPMTVSMNWFDIKMQSSAVQHELIDSPCVSSALSKTLWL